MSELELVREMYPGLAEAAEEPWQRRTVAPGKRTLTEYLSRAEVEDVASRSGAAGVAASRVEAGGRSSAASMSDWRAPFELLDEGAGPPSGRERAETTARAAAAHEVVESASRALGVSVELHAGEAGRVATEEHRASTRGLAVGERVHLHPEVDARTEAGRATALHEVIHLAQARLPATGPRAAAEAEADELAQRAARGGALTRPQLGIDLSRAAANDDEKLAAPSLAYEFQGRIGDDFTWAVKVKRTKQSALAVDPGQAGWAHFKTTKLDTTLQAKLSDKAIALKTAVLSSEGAIKIFDGLKLSLKVTGLEASYSTNRPLDVKLLKIAVVASGKDLPWLRDLFPPPMTSDVKLQGSVALDAGLLAKVAKELIPVEKLRLQIANVLEEQDQVLKQLDVKKGQYEAARREAAQHRRAAKRAKGPARKAHQRAARQAERQLESHKDEIGRLGRRLEHLEHRAVKLRKSFNIARGAMKTRIGRAVAKGMSKALATRAAQVAFKAIPIVGWLSTVSDFYDIGRGLWKLWKHGRNGMGQGSGDAPGGDGSGQQGDGSGRQGDAGASDASDAADGEDLHDEDGGSSADRRGDGDADDAGDAGDGPAHDGGDGGPDAGPADAGPDDAGPADAGPADAGPADAGPTDADTARPDAAQHDAPKPDAPKPDAPQPDAPSPDAAQPDAPKPDAPQPDAAQPDASKPNAPQPDALQPDAPKPDAPKPDAPKPDAPAAKDPSTDKPASAGSGSGAQGGAPARGDEPATGGDAPSTSPTAPGHGGTTKPADGGASGPAADPTRPSAPTPAPDAGTTSPDADAGTADAASPSPADTTGTDATPQAPDAGADAASGSAPDAGADAGPSNTPDADAGATSNGEPTASADATVASEPVAPTPPARRKRPRRKPKPAKPLPLLPMPAAPSGVGASAGPVDDTALWRLSSDQAHRMVAWDGRALRPSKAFDAFVAQIRSAPRVQYDSLGQAVYLRNVELTIGAAASGSVPYSFEYFAYRTKPQGGLERIQQKTQTFFFDPQAESSQLATNSLETALRGAIVVTNGHARKTASVIEAPGIGLLQIIGTQHAESTPAHHVVIVTITPVDVGPGVRVLDSDGTWQDLTPRSTIRVLVRVTASKTK